MLKCDVGIHGTVRLFNPSIMSHYHVNSDARRIMQFQPMVSLGNLFFFDRLSTNFENLDLRGTPSEGLKIRLGWVKTGKDGDFFPVIHYVLETI